MTRVTSCSRVLGRPGTRKDMDTGHNLPFVEEAEFEMLKRFHREIRPHAPTRAPAGAKFDWNVRRRQGISV